MTEMIRKALLEAETYIGDRSAGSGGFWDALEPARKELDSLSSVPEDVARDVETVRGALSLLSSDDVGQKTEGNAALTRLATAAARLPGLEAALTYTEAERNEHEEETISLRAKLTALASERDAARQESAASAAQFAAVTRAMDEQLAPLRERLATLEMERDEKAGLLHVAGQHRDAAIGREDVQRARAEKAEARATAAEKRVEELEERLTLDAGLCPRGDHKVEEHDERGKHPFCGAGTPTPDPGLREAVAKVLEEERATYGIGNPEGITVSIPYASLRGLRAAYDATRASTPPHGLREAVRCPSCEGRGYPGEVGCGRGGQGACPECKGTGRDLDASTPPAVTHADLAAVVEEVANQYEQDGIGHALAYPECHAAAEGAREVLRRVTGGQVPEVLPKARVVEVLARLRKAADSNSPEYDTGWRACVDAARAMLGLTLPTAPGGGETVDRRAEVWAEANRRNEPAPRSVLVPMPTPEGPALVESPATGLPSGPLGSMDAGALEGEPLTQSEPAAPVCGNTTCSRGMLAVCKRPPHGDDVPHRWEEQPGTVAAPRTAPHATCNPHECMHGVPVQCPTFGKRTPAPAAPEVAWEGEGVRVYDDGTLVRTAKVGDSLNVLARELAEAKREARKAAESMRERAATLLEDSALAAEEPRLASRLVAKMRDLPLE